MMKINEQGRSMVEMLGVLAIIGVLSVGGIAGYSKAMNKYKINKTTDQITMLIANIRTTYATSGTYKELTNGQAKKYNLVSNDMYLASSKDEDDVWNDDMTNPFGGPVTIKASSLGENGGADRAFIVAYENLPTEACVSLVTGDWGSSQGSGLIAIGAGATATGAESGKVSNGSIVGTVDGIYLGDSDTSDESGYATPGGSTGTPVPVSTAMKWCDHGSGNSVVWKYY